MVNISFLTWTSFTFSGYFLRLSKSSCYTVLQIVPRRYHSCRNTTTCLLCQAHFKPASSEHWYKSQIFLEPSMPAGMVTKCRRWQGAVSQRMRSSSSTPVPNSSPLPRPVWTLHQWTQIRYSIFHFCSLLFELLPSSQASGISLAILLLGRDATCTIHCTNVAALFWDLFGAKLVAKMNWIWTMWDRSCRKHTGYSGDHFQGWSMRGATSQGWRHFWSCTPAFLFPSWPRCWMAWMSPMSERSSSFSR